MSYNHSPFVRRVLIVLAAALGTVAVSYGVAQAQQSAGPALNPRHPDVYVVQPGDTLWDIASMFLRDPWYWPEIWQINPQVQNPHLIFPGDRLSLTYLGGQPVVQLERGGGTERLSPRIRSAALEEAIPTIPFEAIRAFLTRPAVLDKDQIATLPYVLTPRETLLGSAGRDLYV